MTKQFIKNYDTLCLLYEIDSKKVSIIAGAFVRPWQHQFSNERIFRISGGLQCCCEVYFPAHHHWFGNNQLFIVLRRNSRLTRQKIQLTLLRTDRKYRSSTLVRNLIAVL